MEKRERVGEGQRRSGDSSGVDFSGSRCFAEGGLLSGTESAILNRESH